MANTFTVSVTPQEYNGVLNIGAWDWRENAQATLDDDFISFSISWNGYNKNGKRTNGSGTPTVTYTSPTYIEADLATDLDFQYSGSATGRLNTKLGTYTCRTSWGRGAPSTPSTPSTPSSVNTTFIFTGAVNQSKTVKSSSNTASMQITPDIPGEVYCKFNVNGASKTIATKITGDNSNKFYGFYFFGERMESTMKNLNVDNVKKAFIRIPNLYNKYEYQKAPNNTTYTLYGHQFKDINSCRNITNLNSLTKIKSFQSAKLQNPDEKPEYIDIELTAANLKSLKIYKGIAVCIDTKDMCTIHDIKCSIHITYKD